MAHATGTRIAAALCFFTVILSPIGAILWIHARRKESEREKELKQIDEINSKLQ